MNRAEVLQFYASGAESQRLQRGVAQLEAVRTKQLLATSLPSAPATVLDIGGGTGAYAFWLAARGYAVHLVDPVPQLLAAAHAAGVTYLQPLASVQVGAATLKTGDNRNQTGLSGGFMTAYYHRTEELAHELATAGLACVTMHGVEGPACLRCSVT